VQEEKAKNHPLGIESRNATYPTHSLDWDNLWLRKKHVLSSYPLKRMYKEQPWFLLSASYANQHWECTMDLLQTHNFARGFVIEFVPRYGKDYLNLTYTMLSFRIHRKRTRGEHIGRTRRTKDRTRKSFTLHSMFNQIVYFNQNLVSPPNNAYAVHTLRHY